MPHAIKKNPTMLGPRLQRGAKEIFAPKTAERGRPRAKVLVVDDDLLIRTAVADELNAHHCAVTVAGNGEEAIAQLADHEFDVVVSDLNMPGIDGVELLRHVREQHSHVETIILTSRADFDLAISCLRLGAYDLIRKDKDLKDLVASVKRAVAGHPLRDLRSMQAASSLIFSSAGSRDLPERIVDVASQVMACDDASLMLPDINGQLYVAYSNGLPEAIRRRTRVILGDGIAGRVAQEGKPALIQGSPDAHSRFRGATASAHRDIASSIVYPLLSGARVLGVLNLNRYAPGHYPFRDVDLSRAGLLAAQVVLALENQTLMRKVSEAEKLAAIGQLSSSIAHEINNPASYVLSNIDYVQGKLKAALALQGEGGANGSLAALGGARGIEELCEALADAHAGGIRIRDVVRDLRAMSRAGAETKIPFDINGAVQGALRLISSEFQTGVQVEMQIEPNLGVLGSVGSMTQVFVNLFTNALQAFEDSNSGRAKLKIWGRREVGRVVVDVVDNGPGIPPELTARVFEPFFTTKAEGHGTGLGLPLCREIVAWHGGELHMESVVGQGTTFRIALPSAEMADDPTVAQTPDVQDSTDAPAKPRVLCVDDEAAICRSWVRSLSECDVTTAAHGLQAVEILAANHDFDLIVSDVVMPEMSGVELFERVVQLYPDLVDRFVFVSGSAGREEIRHAVMTHRTPVLEKPVDMGTIRQMIAESVADPITSKSEGPNAKGP